MTLTTLTEQLKAKGYKITEPRKIILNILIQNMHNILSADDLYHISKLKTNKINRSTVYRNIEILLEMKLLFRSISQDGIARYKLICTAEHHHHLICDLCGTIVVYNRCENMAYQKFAQENGFVLTGHTLELHGICSSCQIKMS